MDEELNPQSNQFDGEEPDGESNQQNGEEGKDSNASNAGSDHSAFFSELEKESGKKFTTIGDLVKTLKQADKDFIQKGAASKTQPLSQIASVS